MLCSIACILQELQAKEYDEPGHDESQHHLPDRLPRMPPRAPAALLKYQCIHSRCVSLLAKSSLEADSSSSLSPKVPAVCVQGNNAHR